MYKRQVVEAAGIKDVLSKIIGTSNPHNVVHATMDALLRLESVADVARRRGKTVEEIMPARRDAAAAAPTA